PPAAPPRAPATRPGGRFVEEPRAACRQTNRRALLVTRFRDQVPDRLPDTVRHFDYLPFGSVLPHAAALVHFGGIGSAARALAAGIPQIIHPIKNDQFENARRLGDPGGACVLQ